MERYKGIVLSDHRVGSVNQALALADFLPLNYQIGLVEYNYLASLPNFLLKYSACHLTKTSYESLFNQSLAPQLIISAGRRTAPIALLMKKKFHSKVIQIMTPSFLPFQAFDLIISPKHDTLEKQPNLLKITGSLNNVSTKLLEAKTEFTMRFPELKKFIGVLIGGDSRKYVFDSFSINEFIQALNSLSINYNKPLFISFSRRSSDKMKKLFFNKIRKSFIYDPLTESTYLVQKGEAKKINFPYIDSKKENHKQALPLNLQKYNPYLGILALAEFVISTIDSISICSEAASADKPLYIYKPDNFHLRKHLYFLQQLVINNNAKILNKTELSLAKYSRTRLDELGKVSKYINDTILLGIY